MSANKWHFFIYKKKHLLWKYFIIVIRILLRYMLNYSQLIKKYFVLYDTLSLKFAANYLYVSCKKIRSQIRFSTC